MRCIAGRNRRATSSTSRPSERDLNETYLPAFHASIVEGNADSVMCAYNSVDGVPACASTDLLQKRLRGDWGFQGYVVSDCGAIADIYRFHKYKATAAEASAVAVKAGTDLTCGSEYRSLVEAVKKGLITEAEINRSLERLFVARFKLGMFDPPERVPFSKIPYSVNDSAEHRKMALEAARKSIVLLKNDNHALPLKAESIAVIGPSADDPEALLGNYNGFSSKQVTPLEGIVKQFVGKQVRYALGSTYTSESPALVPPGVLAPPDGNGRGLLAEYFDNPQFQGQPKLSRVEPRPNRPVTAMDPQRGLFVRWTGTLCPSVSGAYVFRSRGMHVYLDDREQSDASLEAGRSYKLRLEGGSQFAWIPPAAPLLAEAVEVVKSCGAAVVFVGLNPQLEGEEMRVNVPGFAGGDRTDLKLPEPQENLVEAAVGTGKPVVVVLTSGSAVAINYPAERAAAVLALWYGGEEAGTAIAETLAGANNPAGRLPVTFYRSVEQLPPFDDYSMKGRTYRYFTGEALFPFGFGLSYSTFDYSGLRAMRTAGRATVSVRVKNTSARDGDEVVQLYLAGGGADGDPIRDLRGFERVHLRAGESREVRFSLAAPKGKVKISVGGGQPTGKVPRLEATL